jgi:GTP pyrophosphokinase
MDIGRVELQELTARMDARRHAYEGRMNALCDRLRRVAVEVVPGASVQGRVKSVLSTWRKMRADGLDLDEMHDLVGLRVLVDRVSDCYAVLNAVHRAWPGPRERDRDFIQAPKANGYQSLHTTRKDVDGFRFEVQVRTRRMHHTIESGEAAHWRYSARRWQEAAMEVTA